MSTNGKPLRLEWRTAAELAEKADNDSFEIAIVAKAKHGVLYKLAQRFGGVVALAEELQVCPTTVSNWINLRYMPSLGHGAKGRFSVERRKSITRRLMELTGKPIEEIFPNFVRERLDEIPREEVYWVQAERHALANDYQRRLEGRLTLSDPSQQAEQSEEAERARDRVDQISEVLKTLPGRQAQVIRLRFGLGEYRVHSLVECGRIIGVTKERVHQIEGEAIEMMRESARHRKLAEV